MFCKFLSKVPLAFLAGCSFSGSGDFPPSIHVNQHAYLPTMVKQATYRVPPTDQPREPRNWSLLQGDQVVRSGATIYHGVDAGSNDLVHIIDFSAVTQAGTYRLTIAEDDEQVESFPFEIRSDAFTRMKYDALSYFYHNRSGHPIEADLVPEPALARNTGHPDTRVRTAACFTQPAAEGCRTFDGSGGWYDAGDHGKYVVNGGISVWTLLNLYERSQQFGRNLAAFGDGTMAIPERNNLVADLLDEVRYELDWFLRMQAPAGERHAGMVHHKLHSVQWTGLPTLPEHDKHERIAQPVSTAATLNFAAVMAQCGRVYADADAAFAARCLAAARTAYAAAQAHPGIYALENTPGAGGYGDANLTDEFYWAAAELFLSTRDPAYWQDMTRSPYHLNFPAEDGTPGRRDRVPAAVMSWPLTAMLGTLSLATSGAAQGLDAELVRQTRELTVIAADHYAAVGRQQGYGQPFDGKQVGWGSNANLVNNMLVLGLANDFTCGRNAAYLVTMANGLAYLLGRNPLDQSYITGYGDRPLLAPHHRFWAQSLDPKFPAPPPGVLSGGPNKDIQDQEAQRHLQGCRPLKCFRDHIYSWSTNEITVNWNAPFAWVVAYLDDLATAPPAPVHCSL